MVKGIVDVVVAARKSKMVADAIETSEVEVTEVETAVGEMMTMTAVEEEDKCAPRTNSKSLKGSTSEQEPTMMEGQLFKMLMVEDVDLLHLSEIHLQKRRMLEVAEVVERWLVCEQCSKQNVRRDRQHKGQEKSRCVEE